MKAERMTKDKQEFCGYELFKDKPFNEMQILSERVMWTDDTVYGKAFRRVKWQALSAGLSVN